MECPGAFCHYLRRLTTPLNVYCIKTAGIFLHSLTVAAGIKVAEQWLAVVAVVHSKYYSVSLKEKS